MVARGTVCPRSRTAPSAAPSLTRLICSGACWPSAMARSVEGEVAQTGWCPGRRVLCKSFSDRFSLNACICNQITFKFVTFS